MAIYVYLSLIPESLISSMLPPEEFGSYYAVGTKKRSRGQAIFFEVDREQLDEQYFPLETIEKRCVPHEDGTPKRTLYLSVYRALEHVPLTALKALHLTTDDGRVLSVDARPYEAKSTDGIHLYQEFCPVTPRVVSRLDPAGFVKFITDPANSVHVPRIAFCDLRLGDLQRDPDTASAEDLPYANIGHLRDCVRELKGAPTKQTKTVIRQMTSDVLFRTVRHGFFAGDQTGIVSFPFPSREQLEREHHAWWRSAQNTFGT
jgi:hypothetical protein